jgi:hypothetical protein
LRMRRSVSISCRESIRALLFMAIHAFERRL